MGILSKWGGAPLMCCLMGFAIRVPGSQMFISRILIGNRETFCWNALYAVKTAFATGEASPDVMLAQLPVLVAAAAATTSAAAPRGYPSPRGPPRCS